MKNQKHVYTASFGISANFCFIFTKWYCILPNSTGEATNTVLFGNLRPKTMRLCYSNKQVCNLLTNTEAIITLWKAAATYSLLRSRM